MYFFIDIILFFLVPKPASCEQCVYCIRQIILLLTNSRVQAYDSMSAVPSCQGRGRAEEMARRLPGGRQAQVGAALGSWIGGGYRVWLGVRVPPRPDQVVRPIGARTPVHAYRFLHVAARRQPPPSTRRIDGTARPRWQWATPPCGRDAESLARPAGGGRCRGGGGLRQPPRAPGPGRGGGRPLRRRAGGLPAGGPGAAGRRRGGVGLAVPRPPRRG